MADKPMDVYLNDHLGGAMLGSDLAEQIRDQSEGTALGDVMTEIAAEIEEDRETLVELMEAMDVSRNPVKQVDRLGGGEGEPCEVQRRRFGRARPRNLHGAREPAAGCCGKEMPLAGPAAGGRTP